MCEMQYHVDVVQYEAEIQLPKGFYNKKRQASNEEDIMHRIDLLIAEVSPNDTFQEKDSTFFISCNGCVQFNQFLNGCQVSNDSRFYSVELQNPDHIK